MPALILALLGLAPSLIGAFAGDKAGNVATQAANLARSVMGTTTDDETLAAIEADPAKATELKVKLAEFASNVRIEQIKAETEQLKAMLNDTANARQLTVSSPLIAKTQVGLACFVMLMFCGVLFLMGTKGVPQGTETLFNVMLGALIAAQTAIMAFFFGNSTSAHSANNAMARIATERAPATAEDLNAAVLKAIRN